MTTLIASQLHDALTYMKAIGNAVEGLPDDPEWGDGMHLILPAIIPLTSDMRGDTMVYAWLVANDFNGYDLTTTDPNPAAAAE